MVPAGRRRRRCAAALTVGLPGVALAAPAVPPAAPPAVQPAARSADAAQRARATWETHGRPTALVVVRPTSVDLVDQGRLTRRIPRTGGTLTLAGLDRYLPRDWLSITGGTARLSAAVVLTPTVTLDVGAPVTTLQLAGGATAPEAASISTGSGGLTLHGVTVTSVDRTSGPGDGARSGPSVRPRLTRRPVHGHRRHAQRPRHRTARRPGAGRRRGPPGPRLPHRQHRIARADVAAAQRHRAPLDGSQGVHLEGVTVSGSAGTGLVLRGDRGTTMSRGPRRAQRRVRRAGDGREHGPPDHRHQPRPATAATGSASTSRPARTSPPSAPPATAAAASSSPGPGT